MPGFRLLALNSRQIIMRQIRGKKALITGAASGIGRAIAGRLAREGVDLYLVDLDEVRLAETLAELLDSGAKIETRNCDVSDCDAVTATIADVVERWDGVDILVNNAGITYYGRTHEMSADHWNRLLSVNLHSHLQFTRGLLPTLLARREAHIVNVCSMFGLIGMPKLTAYCTSKFALVGFSDALRAEYGREGLGVTALCPGFVATNLFTSAPLPENGKGPKIPPRVFCTTPEKVAHAAVKAIRRNRRLVVVEPFAKFLTSVKRFTPGVVDFFLHVGRRGRIERKMTRLDVAECGEIVPWEAPQSLVEDTSQPERRAA